MSTNIDSLANAGYECPLCLDKIELEIFSGPQTTYNGEAHFDKELCVLKCNHVFHLTCIKDCENRGQGCPKCRKAIKYKDSSLNSNQESVEKIAKAAQELKNNGVSCASNAPAKGGDAKQNGSASAVAHAMASSSAPASASAPSLALAKPLARQAVEEELEPGSEASMAAAQTSSAPSAPTLAEIEGASHSAQSSVATHSSFSLAQETASVRKKPAAASARNAQQLNTNNNHQTTYFYGPTNVGVIGNNAKAVQLICAAPTGKPGHTSVHVGHAGPNSIVGGYFGTVNMGGTTTTTSHDIPAIGSNNPTVQTISSAGSKTVTYDNQAINHVVIPADVTDVTINNMSAISHLECSANQVTINNMSTVQHLECSKATHVTINNMSTVAFLEFTGAEGTYSVLNGSSVETVINGKKA